MLMLPDKWIALSLFLASVCAGGASARAGAVVVHDAAANQSAARSAATKEARTAAATLNHADASPAHASAPLASQDASGAEVDPMIERGSRGVARRLLFAGVAAAVVIAVLSGLFAFRHKRQ